MFTFMCSMNGGVKEDEGKIYLVFMELRFFLLMFPSMPKGDIVSMNIYDIPMGDYVNIVGDMIMWLCVAFMIYFFIDINIWGIM